MCKYTDKLPTYVGSYRSAQKAKSRVSSSRNTGLARNGFPRSSKGPRDLIRTGGRTPSRAAPGFESHRLVMRESHYIMGSRRGLIQTSENEVMYLAVPGYRTYIVTSPGSVQELHSRVMFGQCLRVHPIIICMTYHIC